MSKPKKKRCPTHYRKRRHSKVKQDARDQPITIFLSTSEREMLDHFVKKYRLSSRSAYIRGLVMTDVLSHLYENAPSLFDHDNSTPEDD